MKSLFLFTSLSVFFLSCKKESTTVVVENLSPKKLRSIYSGKPGQSTTFQFYYANSRLSKLKRTDSIYEKSSKSWAVGVIKDSYEYNKAGKLAHIKSNYIQNSIDLIYDEQNRLVKKKRPVTGDSICYSYANGVVTATMNTRLPSRDLYQFIFYFSKDLDSLKSYNISKNKLEGSMVYSYNSLPDMGCMSIWNGFDRLIKADFSFSYLTGGIYSTHFLNVTECTQIKIFNHLYNSSIICNRTVQYDSRGFPASGQISGLSSTVEIFKYSYYDAKTILKQAEWNKD